MINFIPFFKRKDFNDGVDEPQEVEHFNSFGEGYDYYLSHYRASMGWYHTRDQAKFYVASDEKTEVKYTRVSKDTRVSRLFLKDTRDIPFEMIRVKGLEDKNIIESKTLAETHVFNEADIDGTIVSTGCDHLVNGNFNKWVDDNDFDIAIPLRRKSRVNNALIIQKKRTKNTIDFFNYRLEKFYELSKDNRAWYGDQKSYESLFLEKGILTKGVKGSGRLGLHNIMGCKILIIPYGGDVVGTNIDDVYGHYFFPNALFFDYKGGRKKKYKVGLERAIAKIENNKGKFNDTSDFINFNDKNTNE